MADNLIIEKLAAWTAEYDPQNLIRIDKRLVHKVQDQNNFVARIEQVPMEDDDCFLGQFTIDPSHPYFFEHEYDHVPGLLMIEGGRQLGTAIAHLYYDVSFDTVFILNEMNIRFFRYVELKHPLFIRSMVRNKLIRKGKLIQMEQDGFFIQEGHEVGFMGGTWQMYDKRVISRFRRSSAKIDLSFE